MIEFIRSLFLGLFVNPMIVTWSILRSKSSRSETELLGESSICGGSILDMSAKLGTSTARVTGLELRRLISGVDCICVGMDDIGVSSGTLTLAILELLTPIAFRPYPGYVRECEYGNNEYSIESKH